MARMTAALAGWLLLVGLVGATGSVAMRWLVLPRLSSPDPADTVRLRRWTATVGKRAGLLLVPAMGLVLWRQMLEFRDPFVPWSEDATLLLGTRWGTIWMLATGATLALVAAFVLASSGRRVGWWLATPLVLGLVAFPALTGHAAGGDGPRWVTLPADVFHVLAAGAWIGGLSVVLYLEHRWRRSPGEDPGRAESPESLLPTLVPVFSPMAVASVGILIATGTMASWIHVRSLEDLFAGTWGRLLILKLAIVLVVLGLGALNWRRITPRLSEVEGPPRMRRAAALELALGTVVLLVTALLVRTSPMGMP